jgi:HNH endonuclease
VKHKRRRPELDSATPLDQRILQKCEPEPNSGCWLWTAGCDTAGYGHMNYKARLTRASRLSWIAFRGPIPDRMWVLHRCDVRCCVNPDHLFLGDAKTNAADMARKQRAAWGERSARSKIRASDAVEIRSLAAAGQALVSIARQFGLAANSVSLIVSRKRWPYV